MPINTILDTAKFAHDCENCVFLGHALGSDLYFCAMTPTVVARWSSDGPDYLSGIEIVPYDACLATALGLASQRGLYRADESFQSDWQPWLTA